jgi:hypothetical protein
MAESVEFGFGHIFRGKYTFCLEIQNPMTDRAAFKDAVL